MFVKGFVFRSDAETLSLNYIKLSEFDICAYFPIRKILSIGRFTLLQIVVNHHNGDKALFKYFCVLLKKTRLIAQMVFFTVTNN